jgi:F-type H+-transporting ATPase subunit epsilon
VRLTILLPFGVFVDVAEVSRIVADGCDGSLGLLPHRLDCVAALTAGILTYQTTSEAHEVYVAVGPGVLIKTGADVCVSVRQAQGGTDLAHLRETVVQELGRVDGREKQVRAVMAKLEAGLLRQISRISS